MKSPMTIKTKLHLKVLFIVVFLATLLFALSIPYYFETMTLWYKSGTSKSMLRGGQLAGMTALVLIIVQIIVAVRGTLLLNIFGIASLSRYHRLNGGLIVLAASTHVLLVLIPEGIANLPIGKKYWPEMTGALLFIIIFILAFASFFKKQLHLSFKRWQHSHKILGYLALLLLTIHVVFVSESFEHSQLRAALLLLIGILLLWITTAKIIRMFNR